MGQGPEESPWAWILLCQVFTSLSALVLQPLHSLASQEWFYYPSGETQFNSVFKDGSNAYWVQVWRYAVNLSGEAQEGGIRGQLLECSGHIISSSCPPATLEID